MNILSLFDGISCGQVALERANIKYDKYFASEIDKHAIKVTQNNYPNTIQLGDVKDVKAKDLPKIDLLLGGSPCQGFSNMGKQLNFDDSRSRLFFEYVRLLKECNPKWFLLENVVMKQEWQDIISRYVKQEPVKINSNLVSAQNRNRLYWTNISNIKQPKNKNLFYKDIKIEMTNDGFWKDYQMEKFYSKKYKSNRIYRVIKDSDKIPCLLAGDGLPKPKTLHDSGRFRILNPIEHERLQTLPDNYTKGVSRTQRYKLLGNCWTVDVVVHILNGIKNKVKSPMEYFL